MKVMSLSSDVRTRHVFGLVSIIWLSSGIAVSQVTLQTISEVEARCGEKVTLTCDANSSKQLDIKLFSWLAKNISVCQNGEGQPDPEVLCENTVKPRHHSLTLTLLNVKPGDQGTYMCKLRSTFGARAEITKVTVQDCLGLVGNSINESHAECWFSGVYPSGTVHWFQEEVDLTDHAVTQEEMEPHGRYNVSSTIERQKGNLSQPYICSLWIPSASKQLSSQELYFTKKVIILSSGSMLKLQWICIMVEIITVKFMT